MLSTSFLQMYVHRVVKHPWRILMGFDLVVYQDANEGRRL